MKEKNMLWQKPCIGLPLRAITINKARLWIFTHYYLDAKLASERVLIYLRAIYVYDSLTHCNWIVMCVVLFSVVCFFSFAFPWYDSRFVSVYVLLNLIKNAVFFLLMVSLHESKAILRLTAQTVQKRDEKTFIA